MNSSSSAPSANCASLTIVILTFNEKCNLGACLQSVVNWGREIFVVDSGSTDGTLDIAERFQSIVVAHPFENHAKQWDWALRNLPITTEWVLALDADQRITEELRDEITKLITDETTKRSDLAGCFINRRQIFRGKWIKHGGYYPKYLLKLFHLKRVQVDESDLVDHHFRVQGRTVTLRHDIIEDNRNEADIAVWIDKHNRYAVLQAEEEFLRAQGERHDAIPASWWGSPDERTLWLEQRWRQAPLFVRPALYFFYRYVLRLGFLDGKQGFIFHFLQAFWYRLLIDIHLDEMRRKASEDPRGDSALCLVKEAPTSSKSRSVTGRHEKIAYKNHS